MMHYRPGIPLDDKYSIENKYETPKSLKNILHYFKKINDKNERRLDTDSL